MLDDARLLCKKAVAFHTASSPVKVSISSHLPPKCVLSLVDPTLFAGPKKFPPPSPSRRRRRYRNVRCPYRRHAAPGGARGRRAGSAELAGARDPEWGPVSPGVPCVQRPAPGSSPPCESVQHPPPGLGAAPPYTQRHAARARPASGAPARGVASGEGAPPLARR